MALETRTYKKRERENINTAYSAHLVWFGIYKLMSDHIVVDK